MNARRHCRKLPPIGIGGWGTAERITANWRVGCVGSLQSAGSQSRAGSCSISLAGTSGERSISNSRRGEGLPSHHRRNAGMGILGDDRPVGIHNAAAGTAALAAGKPVLHCHISRRLISLRPVMVDVPTPIGSCCSLRVSGAARPLPAAPAHPPAPEIRRRPSRPWTRRTTG